MKVTSVTFGFTKNLGNYQSARAEASVEPGTSGHDRAMTLAMAIVKETLDLKLTDAEAEALTESKS